MLNKNPDPLFFARDMKACKPVRLSHRYHPPADGLLRVETAKGVRGGFMVAYGRVVRCSPVLRRRLHVWAQRHTVFVGDPFAL